MESKRIQININQKKFGVAMLLSGEIDVKERLL